MPLSQAIGMMTEAMQPEMVHRAAWKASVMGTLNVIVAVLSVRLIVLVAVCGGIGLALQALSVPDPYRLGALGIYAVFVVCPCIWLASRR